MSIPSARALLFDFVNLVSGFGLGLKLIVAILTLSPAEASDSSCAGLC